MDIWIVSRFRPLQIRQLKTLLNTCFGEYIVHFCYLCLGVELLYYMYDYVQL